MRHVEDDDSFSSVCGVVAVVGCAAACAGFDERRGPEPADVAVRVASDRRARDAGVARELRGEVVAVVDCPWRGDTDLYARVRTHEGDVDVRLGPAEYLQAHGIELERGDLIAVRGVEDVGRAGRCLVAADVRLFDATSVQRRGAAVSLRDADGRPLW